MFLGGREKVRNSRRWTNHKSQISHMSVGKAVIKFNHSVDFYGTPIDIRKSDVQKAIRVGKGSQARNSFFCGFQMLILFPLNKTAMGMQTNFINRLMVIAVEDIGLANVPLLISILPVLFAMSRNKMSRNINMLNGIIAALIYAKLSKFGKPNMIRYTLGLAHYLNAENKQGVYIRDQMAGGECGFESLKCEEHVYVAPLVQSADVHTRQGRKQGADVKRFRQVGALVENSHPLMNDKDMEENYRNNA